MFVRPFIFFLLLPLCMWADYLFVLFDAGETVALKPIIEELRQRGETVQVRVYGPGLRDRYETLSSGELCDSEILVTGVASEIQLQYIKYCSGKTIAYYDNALGIDTISYAPLIRKFEKEADLFLVPSQVAADSSHAKHIAVVGNPDIDQYFGGKEEKKVLTYFGGYDPDYEEAFRAFLNYVAPLDYQVVVRPHPKTDGGLEARLIQNFSHINLDSSSSSSIEAVLRSEVVACHRSSMAIKAACAGKKVLCIDAEGKITHPPSREDLGIPNGATERILRFL